MTVLFQSDAVQCALGVSPDIELTFPFTYCADGSRPRPIHVCQFLFGKFRKGHAKLSGFLFSST